MESGIVANHKDWWDIFKMLVYLVWYLYLIKNYNDKLLKKNKAFNIQMFCYLFLFLSLDLDAHLVISVLIFAAAGIFFFNRTGRKFNLSFIKWAYNKNRDVF